jgi:hypothetical protein
MGASSRRAEIPATDRGRMTKDGRPSRIRDIRYFHGHIHKYLKDQEEAVAFGRRLAWLLNGEGFSAGAYHSLYLFLSSSLAAGQIQITEYGGDWWQRYVHAGVPRDFPDREDASDIVMCATVAALKAIRPDLTTMVDDAEQMVRTHRDNLRFLLKTRHMKRFTVDISFNIAVWPEPSLLFVALTDLSSGAYLEAPPTPMQFYPQAFDLVREIKIAAGSAAILPGESVSARVTSGRYGGAIVLPLSEFLPAVRPVQSKLVSRRG